MSSDQFQSDFLFVRPSLFRGLARTLDLVGSLNSYNWSANGDAADALATYIDWALVGKDLSDGMSQLQDQNSVLLTASSPSASSRAAE